VSSQRIFEMKPNQSWTARLEAFSTWVSQWAGTTAGFIASLGVVATWALTGPLFRYSDTWQLIINTITSIVAFVMVFLIQRAQNKDTPITEAFRTICLQENKTKRV
jgi:low affinity Fe/Cu permease